MARKKDEKMIQEAVAPARGVTSIKLENRWLQEFAIPARGITPIKFGTRRSRRDVEIRNSAILSF